MGGAAGGQALAHGAHDERDAADRQEVLARHPLGPAPRGYDGKDCAHGRAPWAEAEADTGRAAGGGALVTALPYDG
ncbi:hypothetical protein GCM10027168_34690 [Streptomyces capparidis]